MRKKNKKKSFYFEDYDEPDFINTSKNLNIIKVLPSRVIFLFIIFLSLVFIFSVESSQNSIIFEKSSNLHEIQRNSIKISKNHGKS